MRSDKKIRHERFVKHISAVIATADPARVREFEDFIWAAQPQFKWCDQIGVSGPTLRSLAKHMPVVWTKTKDKSGGPIVLYRLGDTPHGSVRHVTNELAYVFRSHSKLNRLEGRQIGSLMGLATVWPQGHQVPILRTVLKDWQGFMAGVKVYQSDDDEAKYAGKFYKFPVLPLIRKYPQIAVELHIMALQGANKTAAPELILGLQKLRVTDDFHGKAI